MTCSQSQIDELKKGLQAAKELGDEQLIQMYEEQIAEIEQANRQGLNVEKSSLVKNAIESLNKEASCENELQEIKKLKKKIFDLEQKLAKSPSSLPVLPALVNKTSKKAKKEPLKSTAVSLPALISKKHQSTKSEAKAKTKKEPKGVVNISEQIKLIGRFVRLMNNKNYKTTKSLEDLLLAIKKALLKKNITPQMPYYEIIKDIEKVLVEAITQSGENVEIIISRLDMENLKDIAKSEKRLLSVAYLNSYFNLARSDKQDKAKMKKLAEKIGNALQEGYIKKDDIYYNEIKRAFGKLNSGKITLTAEELSGLSEICACGKTLGLAGVEMNAQTLRNIEIETLGFQGLWKDFLGDVAKPFSMVIYGLPKTGKTYLALMFADYLSRNFGKVLYVSSEEHGSPTLVKKVRDLDLHNQITFRKDCPDDVSDYDFVFVDSVNRAGLDVETAETLKTNNPNTSFIWVLQATKDGNFRGSQEWTHNADIIVKIDENNIATAQGRYGYGQLRVFEVSDYVE
ncbi:MAG: hypothetical protein RMJ97_07030 [Raineya sp.]|nr:hypothetical protein [Raineya sp.]MDW8296623.1 hypothetical protein [Raineya sp.]